MKKILILATVLWALDSYSYQTPESYPFPIKDRYLASMLSKISALFIKTESNYTFYDLKIKEGRGKVPFFKGRDKVRIGAFTHDKKPRPLTFVLSGFGGQALSPNSKILATSLYRSGHNVITLTNPLHWSFGLAASTSGMPGITQKDVEDIYEYMKISRAKVVKSKKIKISEVNLIGYSLGALQSAFLSKLDEKKQSFNFKKVFMLNSPYNLGTSASQIDGLVKLYKSFSPSKKEWLNKMVYYIAFSGRSGKLKVNSFADIAKVNPFSSTDLMALIGRGFNEGMSESILVSELIRQDGYITVDRDHYSPQPALSEAKAMSFYEYFENIVYDYAVKNLGVNYSLEELIAKNSIDGVKDYLKSTKKVYLFHTADDFILGPNDIQKFDNIFGNRMIVYPHGGHCGQYWFPVFIKDMLGLLL